MLQTCASLRTGGRSGRLALSWLRPQPTQRLVPNDGLGRLLAEGWTFVSTVGSNQAVVRWVRDATFNGSMEVPRVPTPLPVVGGGA